MNKYQEAMDYYWHLYNIGNLYGDTSKEWLEVLQELVDKTDSFEKEQGITASEMFERLGFTRNLNSGKLIYSKNLKGMFRYLEITFDLTAKEIELYDDREAYTVSNALLKAIDKQSEELGWLDEKTCTNESEYNLVDGFECSNCGIIIENYNEIEIDEDASGDRCMKEYAPRYCPNCGRKIVD